LSLVASQSRQNQYNTWKIKDGENDIAKFPSSEQKGSGIRDPGSLVGLLVP